MTIFRLPPTNIDIPLFIGEETKETEKLMEEYDYPISMTLINFDRNTVIHECLHVLREVFRIIEAENEEEFFAYLGAKFICDVLLYTENLKEYQSTELEAK